MLALPCPSIKVVWGPGFMGSITVLDFWSPGPPARIGLLRLEKARGPIAAARVGESGTKMKGGRGDQKSYTG